MPVKGDPSKFCRMHLSTVAFQPAALLTALLTYASATKPYHLAHNVIGPSVPARDIVTT